MGRNKKQSDRIHTNVRAIERLGFRISRDGLKRISEKIRHSLNIQRNTDDVEFLKRASCTRSICRVFYKDRWINVVYSRSTKAIVTILPDEIREMKEVAS